ncbi:hypothetical protein DL96DRAFT_1694003 [Flagelloscypha sp. PMI_526]|nr:hypothetical protein DL96DRAFT_1694003 [Flagelloscypha sp. PMI_526]
MSDQQAAQVPPHAPAEAPSEAPGTEGPSKSELKKRAKALEKEKKAAEKAARQAELAAQKAAAEANDFAAAFYGPLPLHQSQSRPRKPRSTFESLPSKVGETVLVRARVQTSRVKGGTAFFLLRQRTETVQGFLAAAPEKVSKQMVKWTGTVATESIVLVEGTVSAVESPIKTASLSNIEIVISQIHLVSGVEGIQVGDKKVLPFNMDDANRSAKDLEAADSEYKTINIDTRLDNRVLDLRTYTNQAIFKLQAAIGDLFREHLKSQNFLEIHSPKLQGAATESGASVFEVSYFKGKAYLAQSPQLAKQMCIAADFERVYEIGPVFRAEKAFTHRHLTEFIGLDLEMTIEEHYHEVVELLDSMFLAIFRGLREQYKKDIDIVREQFPADEFIWREGPEGTLKMSFKEAVDLLVEDGVPRSDLDDIGFVFHSPTFSVKNSFSFSTSTENEKRLGRIVRKKYETDYFIIDKFPMELRPFYTMPDPDDPTVSNSYDFFMRGEEILSGAQRIHDPAFLAEKMLDERDIWTAFRLGCPPHGGGGIGLERVLMLFLKLNNIRRATLFARDPKRLEP